MRRILPFAMLAVGAALSAASARAAVILPLSIGDVAFHGFFDASPHSLDAGCGSTFFALGTASCSGVVGFSGGPLGEGFHVTGAMFGAGTTTAASGDFNPTATAAFTASTVSAAIGEPSVETRLQYYVTVAPIGALTTSGLLIPLDFEASGFLHGAASSGSIVGGRAATHLRTFHGEIDIDGSQSTHSFDDEAESFETVSSVSKAYDATHLLVFNFEDADAVAQVDLEAICTAAGSPGSVSCHASADPFLGFDQAAFDAKMGAKTFNLADFFKIVVSSGLEPGPSGVPEPGAWAMLILGFAGMGAALRRRRLRTA